MAGWPFRCPSELVSLTPPGCMALRVGAVCLLLHAAEGRATPCLFSNQESSHRLCYSAC
jgi:hypothetical protein